MLKISVNQTANLATLKLEGKLAGPWVFELERVWRELATPKNSASICLDIRNLTFADKEGRALLRKICQKNVATFIADSPLTRYYADEASHDFPEQLGHPN